MTGRRSFGPVVLLGLASSALASVAGHKPVVRLTGDAADAVGAGAYAEAIERIGVDDGLPLAGALALVLLAGWGVLLVTRGVVRRVVAGGLVLISLGLVAATLMGWRQLLASFPDDVAERIGAGSHGTELALDAETTGWLWALVAASLLATVAAALAVVLTPSWPEMGSRYDAPSSATPTTKRLEERSSIDVWKSLDEGDDPTA